MKTTKAKINPKHLRGAVGVTAVLLAIMYPSKEITDKKVTKYRDAIAINADLNAHHIKLLKEKICSNKDLAKRNQDICTEIKFKRNRL